MTEPPLLWVFVTARSPPHAGHLALMFRAGRCARFFRVSVGKPIPSLGVDGEYFTPYQRTRKRRVGGQDVNSPTCGRNMRLLPIAGEQPIFFDGIVLATIWYPLPQMLLML